MTDQSTFCSETDGGAAEHTPTILNPAEFDQACCALVEQFQGHELHRQIDLLVTDLLCNLGYGDGMRKFLDHALPYHTKETNNA
jgi:hypothetical protein